MYKTAIDRGTEDAAKVGAELFEVVVSDMCPEPSVMVLVATEKEALKLPENFENPSSFGEKKLQQQLADQTLSQGATAFFLRDYTPQSLLM